MGLFSKIFGGGTSAASETGQQQARQENIRRQGFIERVTGRGRTDAKRLFDQSLRSERRGFRGALDVIGQGIPEQLGLFQRGNVAAQGALSEGLPQFIAAILGEDIDFSAFQPRRLEADTSFLENVRVPRRARRPEDEVPGTLDLLAGQPATSAQPPPPRPSADLADILAQIGGGQFGGRQFARQPNFNRRGRF